MTRLQRARRAFPRHGPSYELFDTSLALLWIAAVGYLLFPVPPTVTEAVGAPLVVLSEYHLGLTLVGCTAAGTVLSYTRWRDLGYKVTRVAALFMCLNFAATSIRLLLDHLGWIHLPAEVDTTSVARTSLIYFMLYGYAFRRLKRDNGADE